MRKNSSYYTKGIRRKITALVFQKGMLSNKGQIKLIKDLIADINYPVESKFSTRYVAFDYVDEDYVESLRFENNIAIAENDGKSNPLTPAIYALHCYNENKMDVFKLHADYLLTQMKISGEQCYWEYDEDVVRFILPAPWTSGISQGVITSVMLRMYRETQEEKYLDIAKGAIAFSLDSKNGLRTELQDGYWIEEYPTERGRGVLNGFLFFLIALAELSSLGHFQNDFQEGIKGLLSRIPFYHKGIYLKYASNIPDLCNPWYDKIHYHQLNAMYALTKENVFLKLEKYWTNTSSTVFKT